jgi:hypothetical protein
VSPVADLFDRILDAVVAAVRGLALDGIGANVFRQKVPDDLNAREVPLVLVGYLGEAEEYGGGDWRADVIGYPALVQAIDGTLREDDPQREAKELAWLGRIDDRLRYQRLDGVPEVTTCVPQPRAILEAMLLQAPELQRSSKLYRMVARRGRR